MFVGFKLLSATDKEPLSPKYHTSHAHKGTLLNIQKKIVVDTNNEKLNLKPQNVSTGKTEFKLIETMFYYNMHIYTAFL